jgi:hypothetical protein
MEIMSDLAVANLDIENHGAESSPWAAPVGLTATARNALTNVDSAKG